MRNAGILALYRMSPKYCPQGCKYSLPIRRSYPASSIACSGNISGGGIFVINDKNTA